MAPRSTRRSVRFRAQSTQPGGGSRSVAGGGGPGGTSRRSAKCETRLDTAPDETPAAAWIAHLEGNRHRAALPSIRHEATSVPALTLISNRRSKNRSSNRGWEPERLRQPSASWSSHRRSNGGGSGADRCTPVWYLCGRECSALCLSGTNVRTISSYRGRMPGWPA